MSAPVRAALFDVFGTVVDWRAGVAAAVRPVLAAHRVTLDPFAFADAWRAEYQPAMERVRSGARDYVPLDDLHRENLERVLARAGLSDRFDGRALDELAAAWERLPAWPGMAAALARLRQRMIVAPCSNGSVAIMVRLARFAGLGWDCVLGADLARAYKPSPAAYLRSCAALRLPPEAVVMVTAHNDDLAHARAAGLRTAFAPRPGEHGPGQQSDLAPAGPWDFTAETMETLLERIAAAG